jgi:uncharacterized protein (DUF952 family)
MTRSGTAVVTGEVAKLIFKIVARSAWDDACRDGVFAGSADDMRDGFIHLSAAHQLEGTLARHFKGKPDLLLIAFDSASLGDALRWEPSRNGDLFPHLYAHLPTGAARSIAALTLDSEGVPIIPGDAR